MDDGKMIWPFPGNTLITSGFSSPRPMSNPGEHIHGAIDVKAAIGSEIIAPERGFLYKYCAIRYKDGQYWDVGALQEFPYKNYFYDMFGGIIVLKGDSGITHIFAHIYQNQLYNKESCEWKYIEEKKESRFPVHAYITEPYEVFKGEHLGYTGNSGYSTGAHCHYEQHRGFVWQKHEDRPNPGNMSIWGEFE